MRKTLLLFGLLLAACAKPPEDIAAAVVPHSSFAGRSCAELDSLAVAKQAELTQLETNQRATATEDKNSMSAIHIPVGSLRGGDREEDVARAKGEVKAIWEARRLRVCAAS